GGVELLHGLARDLNVESLADVCDLQTGTEPAALPYEEMRGPLHAASLAELPICARHGLGLGQLERFDAEPPPDPTQHIVVADVGAHLENGLAQGKAHGFTR